MWEFYCDTCKKVCDHDEVELREDAFEGDWQEVHIDCNSKVTPILKMEKI